jgi:ABC-2 type transport system permease protein
MTALSHYAILSRRSIINTFRQPIAIIPALTFPLLFLAINSAALNEAIRLPGFPPVENYLQFMIATTIIQGALFGSIAAGGDMARDIEGGFFDRLYLAPISRWSVLVGRVAGAWTVSFLQAWLFFGVALLFGLHVEGGFLGMLGVASIASVLGAGLGSISMSFAIRTGSSEAVQGAFPALFAFLFLSSAFFPRELMSGWFADAAAINPLSHLIESSRYLVIFGASFTEFVQGVTIAAVVLLVGLLLSSVALRRRLSERA